MALLYEDLTERIIGVCIEVHNELGFGYSESVYHKSLLIALADAGLEAKSQVQIPVVFRQEDVGHFVADLVVEGKVIVELKAVPRLAGEHSTQVIKYLKGTGLLVAMLANFGAPRLQYKRLEHPDRYTGKQ